MKIGHQAPHVTRGIRASGLFVLDLEVVHEGPGFLIPIGIVSLIDTVYLSSLRYMKFGIRMEVLYQLAFLEPFSVLLGPVLLLRLRKW